MDKLDLLDISPECRAAIRERQAAAGERQSRLDSEFAKARGNIDLLFARRNELSVTQQDALRDRIRERTREIANFSGLSYDRDEMDLERCMDALIHAECCAKYLAGMG